MNDPARPWVESARRSLDAAEILHGAGRWPQTCFHAQQCTELMLKAAVAHTGVAPPRVHGIIELMGHVDAAVRDTLQHLAQGLQRLDRYYEGALYPSG